MGQKTAPVNRTGVSPVDQWLGPRQGTLWANARVDFLAAVLFGIFGGLTIPFIPVMARRLGAAPLEISLVVAAQAITMLLSLFWVNITQRADPVRLVVWMTALGRALFLLMPLVQTPRVFVAVVFVHYALLSVAALGYSQVMRVVYPDDARGRIMGLVRIGMAGAWIVASLVGGQMMQTLPFQTVFAVAAVFGLAGAVVFIRMRVDSPPERVERVAFFRAWRTLRDDRQFRLFLGAFFAFGFGAWLTGPAIPIMLVDVLHATNFQVGLLGAVTSGVWLVAYYQWGRLIDQQTATGVLPLTFLIGALTPLIFLLALDPWMVMLSGVTDGFTSAGVDLGWLPALLQYAPQGRVPHYVAIFNTFVGVRGTTAPLLSGLLIPHIGVRPVFGIAAVCILAGAWLMRRAAASMQPSGKGIRQESVERSPIGGS
jgi:MFS family permease